MTGRLETPGKALETRPSYVRWLPVLVAGLLIAGGVAYSASNGGMNTSNGSGNAPGAYASNGSSGDCTPQTLLDDQQHITNDGSGSKSFTLKPGCILNWRVTLGNDTGGHSITLDGPNGRIFTHTRSMTGNYLSVPPSTHKDHPEREIGWGSIADAGTYHYTYNIDGAADLHFVGKAA